MGSSSAGRTPGDGAVVARMMKEVVVAVGVCEKRSSKRAFQWAIDNLAGVDRFVLVHVTPRITSIPTPVGNRVPISQIPTDVVSMYIQEMKSRISVVFLPFKKLCRDRQIDTVILDDDKPSTGLLRYVSEFDVENLVLGASNSNFIARKLKGPNLSSVITKVAPQTCNIYVISRNKVIKKLVKPTLVEGKMDSLKDNPVNDDKTAINERRDDTSLYRKLFKFYVPHAHQKKEKISSFALPQDPKERKLSEFDDGASSLRLGNTSEHAENSFSPPVEEDAKILKARDLNNLLGLKDDCFLMQSPAMPVEAKSEVERLRHELQITLSMYNRTCEELVYAKKKVQRLSVECAEEVKKVKDAQEREEMARKAAEEEKIKHMSALKEVAAAKQLLAEEAYARQKAEVAAMQELSERRKLEDALFSCDQRYRRYSREELEIATESFSVSNKIGEGGYGSVYKCNLDHTPVAVKLLHQDASNKKDEFLREVEVLSQIRHPHMVLLLGACPENGCLVYEYLANGSLEDRLLCKGGTPPLSWATRFRILYEVACVLAFLHSSKPEPIVHRDLKPANILLDSNYVSKLGDVGLAQLMSNVVPDAVTEYRETLLAGTLYYMDPEYQRTGTVRPKSDLYGFGIIVLQTLTAKPPIGLVKMIETSICDGSFPKKLDKSIKDWPLEQCEDLAHLALKCTRLRCRERPDLELEVIPDLQRFKDVADAHRFKMIQGNVSIPRPYICPILQV
ncbi:unnamed protein product [Victoria cruziana]